jgi:formate-dependent nitrite reductase membrane component NrfD
MTHSSALPKAVDREGYYGLPMLKRPLWGWEIALYFFSEGISSGSFVLSTLAQVCGAGQHQTMIRNARYISLATLLPCPPLLIADLGRPERFLHMLRVFKPQAPMSMGSWALTAFSQPVWMLAAAEYFGLRWMPERVLGVAGLPFAFFMLVYPGVLLSTTSIPAWARTHWLGPLLASSSMATAASTLAIAAALDPAADETTREALHNVERFAHLAEAAAVSAYVCSAGVNAKPLTRGRYARMFRVGAFVAGIALPALITASRKKPTRTLTLVSGALTLVGALALKWSVVYAGHDSAEDAVISRHAASADADHPGWLPTTEKRTGVMAGS